MAHPDLAAWADFARGLSGDPRRGELEGHLATGCRRCAANLRLIERVMAVAAAERGPAPPAAAIRLVKAMATLGPYQRRQQLAATLLRVLRDSAAEPAPVGTRGEAGGERHLLSEHAGFALELTVAADTDGSSLSGTCVGPGGEPLAGVPWIALGEDRYLATGTTGARGQLRAGGLPGEPAELWLFPQADGPLALVLGPAAADPWAG